MSLQSEDPTSGRKVQSIHIKGRAELGLFRGREVTLIRGELDPKYFSALVIPSYQREAMDGSKQRQLLEALAPGGIGVPDDLILCSRTTEYLQLPSGKLSVPTRGLLVLDGHQRVATAKLLLKEGPGTIPLGIKLFLGTRFQEELDAFHQLNRLQTKVSSDVLWRNMGDDNDVIRMLRHLEETMEGFPQIQWSQRLRRGDVVKANTLFGVVVMLHGFKAQGLEELADRMQKTTERVGNALLEANIRTFFSIIKNYFVGSKLEDYAYRAEFLRGLAQFFSMYSNFWDPKNPYRLAGRSEDLTRLTTTKWQRVDGALGTTSPIKNLCESLKSHFDANRTTSKLADKDWKGA